MNIQPYNSYCIHHIFEERAYRSPEVIAVRFEQQSLTYAELNERANQLAHYLQSKGVGPDTLVGLCVDRSLEMIIGILGILKAGGAYVPLDPSYPSDRLTFMIVDSQISLFLTQAHLINADSSKNVPTLTAVFEKETISCEIFCLDTDWSLVDSYPRLTPINSARPEHLAYVIFTSGSTGQPKGVLVPHRGLMNIVVAQREAFKLKIGDCVLQAASLSFDASVFEMLLSWGSGASLCLITREILLSGYDFHSYLQQHDVSMIVLTPSLLASLPQRDLPYIHTIAVAGEACTETLIERWAPKRNFFNLYGPTEASIWSTIQRCEPGYGKPLIGKPIINTSAYILDDEMKPVPVGTPGELYLGGIGIARGYLHRPKLTKERFVSDPFSLEPDAMLYKTGDVVKYDSLDRLDYLGRIDQQVKIRGFRIELGEIEAALLQYPAIQECVVIAREEQSMGEKQLTAYVVATPKHIIKTADLRNYLYTQLPIYMIPTFFVILSKLPLTNNGKIDREAVLMLDVSPSERATLLVLPRTYHEEQLMAIWESVLGRTYISVHDNFFELGGHSLLATQVIVRIRDVFACNISFSQFFLHPTITDLATIIEQGKKELGISFPQLQPASYRTSLPLSLTQERIWFLQQMNSNLLSYHAQASFRFTGTLDSRALEATLNEIVRRHEIFRTTFPAIDGQPIQLIHSFTPFKLPIIDLQDFPVEEREQEAQQHIAATLNTPFDLTQLPLVRWILYRISSKEYILLHSEHHLLHDGWSFTVFVREMITIYKAFANGEPSPLSDLPIQFADFAIWQREWMHGPLMDTQREYWKKQLAGSSTLQLSTDHPHPAYQTFNGAAIRFELHSDLCNGLRSLNKQEGVTLFMSMIAGFSILLSRYTQQDDISIGSGLANRRTQETELLIGMMINTIVLRFNLANNPTFHDILMHTRDINIQAQTHQDLNFYEVVKEVQPTRALSHNPLFQVVFGFHDSPMPSLEVPDLEINLVEALNNRSAKFDLSLTVIPRAEQVIGQRKTKKVNGITLQWEYNTDLFERETIERMMQHYVSILETMVANPSQPIRDFSLLTTKEHEQIAGWNETATAFPRDVCIHELFEEHVQHCPDAIAIRCGLQEITYGSLNEQANQVAHLLRTQGIIPDTLIGLFLGRSVEMVIGMLGILKAGGAYVPLDHDYPPDRLAFMLADTQISLILTKQHLRDKMPYYSGQIVCLDTDWPQISLNSIKNLTSLVAPHHLAHLIYTSGSTGVPKGVQISHIGVTRLVCNTNYMTIVPSDKVLHISNVCFDATTFEVWGALLNGAQLIIYPFTKPTLEELKNIIIENQITTALLTTSLFHLMVDEQIEALTYIRQLLVGGDVLSLAHVKQLLPLLPPKHVLINAYGPTENTTITCCYVMNKGTELKGTMPIGSAISNTSIYILDNHLQLVPINVVGELYIGGEGLARGYHHRPDITAERFILNPFSEHLGTLLYRTGDLVRYRSDGAIEYVGRADNQVKIRGFRIEPGEIEEVLNQHVAVKEAIVLAIQDKVLEKYLVAYIVLQSGEKLTDKDVRSFLVEILPDYMIPSAFIYLDSLPITPNGKLDRNALPLPEQGQQQNHISPRNTLELRLANIFEDVLNIFAIGINDNFFARGGHSLLAVRLISRIKKQFGRELPLSILFQEATVEHLANVLSQKPNEQLWSPLVTLQPHGSKPPIFWIHPAGGAILRYLPLIYHLGSDQPSYAFEESFFNPEWVPTIDIKDMAHRYVSEILAIQPQGPYYLGGHSMGGTIAFEVANILQRNGYRVALLALLDTLAPLPCNQPEDEDETSLIAWYAETLIRDQTGEDSIEFSLYAQTEQQLRQMSLDKQFDYLLDIAKKVNFVPIDTDTTTLQRLIKINLAHTQAAQNYIPENIYPHTITLFRATERLSNQTTKSLDNPTLGWNSFTSEQIEIYEIPGCTHRSMIEEPHVQDLAEKLLHCIKKASSL